MGFNLKEKWQNANKRNVAIIAAILILVVAIIIGGIEYFQFQKMKAVQQDQEVQSYENMPIDLNQAPKKPSEYKIGIEYNKAMKQDKPVLVLFYADWCHYCIKFMPIYQKLSEKYKDTMNFAKVNVEDKNYEKLVKNVGLTGYPTVFIMDPKYDNKILLSNALLGKVEDVSNEIDRFLRIRKILDSKK